MREVARVSADAAFQIKGSRGSLSKTKVNSNTRLANQVVYFNHVRRILKNESLAKIVPRWPDSQGCWIVSAFVSSTLP